MARSDRIRVLPDSVLRYYMDRFDLPAEAFSRRQTIAYPDEPFADSRKAGIYHLGELSILRFDPALESELRLPGDLDSRDIEAADLIAAQGSGLGLAPAPGGYDSFLDEASFVPFTAAGSLETRIVDPVADDAVLRRFYSECSKDDLDEAEIFVDEPDPVIFGTFENGKMIAYSSHRIWGENMADIGVLTHPDHRRRGLGRGVVSALCEWHFANGVLPMYRVGTENLASQALCAALGFRLTVEIEMLSAPPTERPS